MVAIRHKRGNRAQIDAAAAAAGLAAGEIYLVTDEGRLTVGTGPASHQPLARLDEAGGAAADPWSWTLLAGDVSTTALALAPVPGLSFPAAPAAFYMVELFGAVSSAASTTGLALALDSPGGNVIGQTSHPILGGSVAGVEQNADSATSGATSGVRAANANVPVSARFLVATGAEGGTVSLMMRSEVAGSPVTLRGGLTAFGYRRL